MEHLPGPERPGPAPVAVPGRVRLGLEWLLFGLAAVALADAGRPLLAGAFAAVTTGRYVIALGRVQ